MLTYICLIWVSLFLNSEALIFQTENSVLPAKDECGLESSVKLPWVVYIPAQPWTYNPSANIRCVGALISKRYVILNKACLQFYIDKVHLGRANLTNDEGVLKLDISEKVVNDTYDIILLRLAEDVEFSDSVRPICLPTDDFQKPITGDTVHSSGWGLTSSEGAPSNIKKSVQATLDENCTESKNNLKVKDRVCIKVQETSNDKPCSGDEGSPIMFKSNGRWIIYGVLVGVFDSFDKPCAIKDAAIGSRITEEVLQWIVEKMY